MEHAGGGIVHSKCPAVQGFNTAVQGFNTAVQGFNTAVQRLLLGKDYTSSVSFRNLSNSETDFARNRNKMVES